jgi:hypothetical protein
MRTRFLVQARYCSAINPQMVSDAGATLVRVGRLEEDGTVLVEVDTPAEDGSGRALADAFAPYSAIPH